MIRQIYSKLASLQSKEVILSPQRLIQTQKSSSPPLFEWFLTPTSSSDYGRH